MTNPQLGFTELAPAQSQPEVVVNAADRAITRALAGEIEINFQSDADLSLKATDPPAADDQWGYATIRMTDTGNVLTTARAVIFPDVDLLYGGKSRLRFEFVNDTAHSLTIKGTAGTGVTVPAHSKALVRWNGMDVEEVAAAGGGGGGGTPLMPIQIAASQFGMPIEDAVAAAYFRAPFGGTIEEVRGSLLLANSNGDIEIDIKINGVSVLEVPIVIEQGDKTSKTAAVQPELVSNASFEDDDEVTIDIDAPSGADGQSLIVTMLVRPAS